jgi:hypothetical protein
VNPAREEAAPSLLAQDIAMNHRAFALCTGLLTITAGCGNGGIPLTGADAGDGAAAHDTNAPYNGGTGGSSGGAGGSKEIGGSGGSDTGGEGGSLGGSGGSFGGSGGSAGSGGTGGAGGSFGGAGGSFGGAGGSFGGAGGSFGGAGGSFGGAGGSVTGGSIGSGGAGGSVGSGGSFGTGGFFGTGGSWGIGGYGGYYCPPYGGHGGYGYGDAGAPPDSGAADGGIVAPDPCLPPLPPDAQRDELAKAYCGAAERCCKPGELFTFPFGGGPSCSYYAAQNLISILGQMRASQVAGRSTIDESAFKACIQNLQTGACKDVAGVLTFAQGTDVPGCPRITQGKVADGEGCDRDFECLDGLYCDGATCRPRPSAGQPCPDGACATGLYCRGFNSGPRCAAKEPDGRLCDSPQECASGTCAFDPQYSTNLCGPPTTCTGK